MLRSVAVSPTGNRLAAGLHNIPHPIFETPHFDVDDVETHQLQIHHITHNGTVDASHTDNRDADGLLAGTRSNRRQEAEEEVVQGQGYVHSGDSNLTISHPLLRQSYNYKERATAQTGLQRPNETKRN